MPKPNNDKKQGNDRETTKVVEEKLQKIADDRRQKGLPMWNK